ncbi:MAG: N-acetylmuramoyl-L-alanine amidase [Clostridia bacterium]|nr:N-acetylmuramoyl-L-alanine amidase [Clostridia bacterium]
MKLITCMHTQSRCYGVKRKPAKPVGIVVHSTGANNPSIKRWSQPSDNDPKRGELLKLIGTNTYGNHWNRADVSKAVHYVIGKLADGNVATVQNLPEDIACWGSGSGKKGSYNYDPVAHIQFEICEDNLWGESYFKAVYKEATELCADICYRHGWDASVIVSHKEAHAKGYGSNHADIDHWLKNFKLTMKDFRAEVQKLLDEMNKPVEPEKVTLYAVTVGNLEKEAADALIKDLSDRFSDVSGWASVDHCVSV